MNLELERCIEVFLSQYKKTTRVSYTRPLIKMSRNIGQETYLHDISPLDMLEYIGKVKSLDYAPATINKHIKTVKVFFNWCVRMEFIEKSPAANIPNVRTPQKINRGKAMQPEEFDKIIEYFKVSVKYPVGNYRWRDYAAFLFLADTGCRRGGVSTLKFDGLNLAARVATVHEKSGIRDVYFGDECAWAIEHWIDEARRKGISSEWVFSTTGKQWQPASVSQMIRRTAKKAGVRITRSSHSMRHMFGQRMADNMVNPKIAQAQMGHSDVKITIQHYYDTDPDQVKTAVRKHSYRPHIRDKIHIFDGQKKQSS